MKTWTVVLIFLFHLKASALFCTCVLSELHEDDFRHASTIVWGKVVQVTHYGEHAQEKLVTFKVYRSYKGSTEAFIELRTQDESMCGLTLVKGEKWLLFVSKRNTVGLCSPNVRYSKHGDETPAMVENRLKKFHRYIEKIKTYEKL